VTAMIGLVNTSMLFIAAGLDLDMLDDDRRSKAAESFDVSGFRPD
jgi:hypothetical protein